jgi:pyrimidine-specific ribonucleoside hydrolase
MATGDPDDVFALCFVISHPGINLKAVTVSPGTAEQVGLIYHILSQSKYSGIPIGSQRPDYNANCVVPFYYQWLGSFQPRHADDLGYRILNHFIMNTPDIQILTGAHFKNFERLDTELSLSRWVAQGGFAGSNIVPHEWQYHTFAYRETCPSSNFSDFRQVRKLLDNKNFIEKCIVSKNVTHKAVYDVGLHARMEPLKNSCIGLNLIYSGMDLYLKKKPYGKKFHDPLAACVVVNPDICTFEEVELFKKNKEWGAKKQIGTNTFISINLDHEAFFKTLTMQT